MTNRKRLYLCTCLLGTLAACLAAVPLTPVSACDALFLQAGSNGPSHPPNRDGQWVRCEAPSLVALEPDETDETEELSGGERASDASRRHGADALRYATLMAASRQPKLRITPNALRVRLQI